MGVPAKVPETIGYSPHEKKSTQIVPVQEDREYTSGFRKHNILDVFNEDLKQKPERETRCGVSFLGAVFRGVDCGKSNP